MEMRITGFARCSRAALLQGTALRAAALVVLSSPALAQLAPTARPTGGAVVGGQAGISQVGSSTTINQLTQRAAINWQSFDVGSQSSVTFRQPNSSSVALNRVVGPNPSEIAGRITANGQVVIVNQSGVVFDHGAQVDTAGLVVSASGITNQNFMAGHMVFDQAAHAGAKVVNNGTITIQQAGLAALVAPTVGNTGLIRATLGRVILGGATTYTLDLYGDGLLALNVTGQVTLAQIGGRVVPALVTNSGIIAADGGTVVLTASAADGLIRTLVTAGGTVTANSVGASQGRVLVSGIGGSVEIDGAVSATGLAAGTRGGQVVADATGTVTVGSSAIVDASGDAGGGLVAIGTTAARASGGAHTPSSLTAQAVAVSAGSRLAAAATGSGAGGKVTILSSGVTSLAGSVSVAGGARGGNAGAAELAGTSVSLDGIVNAAAPKGLTGDLSITGANIIVDDQNPGSGTWEKPSQLENMGNVTLTATNSVNFEFSIVHVLDGNILDLGTNALVVTAGAGGVNVDRGYTIKAGDISMTATGGQVSFDTQNGSAGVGLRGDSTMTATNISLSGDNGVVLAGATLNAPTSIGIASLNDSITGTGVLNTGSLTAAASTGISLTATNTITTLGSITTSTGDIDLDAAFLVISSGVTASSGNVNFSSQAIGISNTILASGTVSLTSTKGGIFETGSAGLIHAASLTGSASTSGTAVGQIDLRGANLIGTVTSLNADGNILLADSGSTLEVAGLVKGGGTLVSLKTPSLKIDAGGMVSTAGTIDLRTDTLSVLGTATTTGMHGLIALDSDTSTSFTVSQNTIKNLSAGNSGTLALGSLDGSTPSGDVTKLVLTGGVDTTGVAGTLGLFATGTGTVTAPGGVIASLLYGKAGTFTLTGDNAVANISDMTSNVFTFSQTDDVNVSGSVTGTTSVGISSQGTLAVSGSIVGSATSLSGDVLKLSGNATGSDTLTLTALSGTISESGSLQTALLSGSATGSASLTGSNTVTGLGDFTAAGLTLKDISDLKVTGSVDGTAATAITDTGTLTISAAGSVAGTATTLTAASIFINGGITADTSLDLTSTVGTISASGSLDTGTLSFSGKTGVALLGSNTVNNIDTSSSNGDFLFNDNAALSIVGTVAAGSAGNPHSLVINSATLTVANVGGLAALGGGTIDLGTDDLTVNGTITTGATGLVGIDTLANPGTLTFSSTGASGITTGELALGSINGSTATGHVVEIDLAANLNLGAHASTLGLFTTSNGTIVETGGITVGTLTGASGNVTLTGANTITALGSFTAATFDFSEAGDLAVTGAVTSDATTLSAASLTIPGSVTGTTTLALFATAGTINETGSLNGSLLTGSATGSAALTGTNHIGTLGSFTADGFTFNDASGLSVTGSVDGTSAVAITDTGTLSIGAAGSIAGSKTMLKGSSVGIDGTVSADSTLSLIATTGSISETGTLTAGVLTGSAATSASFTNNVSVTELSDFTAADFTLSQTGDLGVPGTVFGTSTNSITSAGDLDIGGAAKGAATSLSGATLEISGTATGSTSLTLTAMTGTLNAAGSVNAGVLTGSAAGSASFAGSNAIHTLSAFTADGLTLKDASDLTIAGAVDGGTATSLTDTGAVTLSAAGSVNGSVTEISGTAITLDGTITADTSLALTATAGAIMGAGELDTPLLTGSATGSIDLSGSNGVGTLGSLTASSIAFTESGALDVTGSVKSANTSLSAGSLTIDGSVTGSNTLTLIATAGDISSTNASALTAGTLTGSATGSVFLDGANTVHTLGDFTADTFVLYDTPDLNVTGSVTGTGAGVGIVDTGTLTLADTGSLSGSQVILEAAALLLPGTISAPGTLTLEASTGTISQTGSLSAGTLTLTSGTGASFTGTDNVGELDDAAVGGNFTLIDTHALSVAGSVGVPMDGTITLNTPTLTVTNAGTLQALSGTIALRTDSFTINGPVKTGAGQGLITVDALHGGTLSVNSSEAAQFSAQELSFGSLDGVTASGNTREIDISGTLDLGSHTQTLGLFTTSTGTINAPGGISVNTLIGSSGTVSLTGDNSVTNLGDFTAASFTFSQDGDLDVTGAVQGGALASITSNLGSLVVDGSVTASATALSGATLDIIGSAIGSLTMTLTASNGTIAAPGTLTTALLSGSAAGSTVLTGTNAINAVGSFTSNGFVLSENQALTVSGPLDSGDTTLTAKSISIDGALSAGTLSLTATAGTIAGAGVVSASLLTGSASGSFELTGANSITGLGDFTASGFLLDNAADLNVSGSIAGTSAVTIANTAGLTVSGSVDAAATSLTGTTLDIPGSATGSSTLMLFATTGTMTESGSLTGTTLSGNAAGSASLTGSNTIGTLGGFTADGLTLDDATSLVVAGTVNGTSGVTIADTGTLTVASGASITGDASALSAAALTLSGSITAATSLDLTANNGTIAESGTIDAGKLTGSSTGSTGLTGTNSIAQLGDFTAGGFTLSDGVDLSVTGSVDGTSTASITDSAAISLSGAVNAAATSLKGTSLDLTGSVTGSNTLTLTATNGTINETGALIATLLTGSATGSASLIGGGNAVTDLGNFSAASFTFAQDGALDVTGAVTGGTLASLTSNAGTLSVDGSVAADHTDLTGTALDIAGAATGSLTLTLTATNGDINATGALTTDLLTGSATGSASLTGTNAIGTLGHFSANPLILNDTLGLTITDAIDGGTGVTINETGTLTIADTGSITGNTTKLSATEITIDGAVTALDALMLTSTGTIGETGMLDVGSLSGSSAGSTSLTGQNTITTLGSFSAAGFNLKDMGDLDVTGPVKGTAAVTIADTGALTIDGTVNGQTTSLTAASLMIPGTVTAATKLSLTATAGAIGETGSLNTGMLTGSATGSASLTGANSITTLGSFTATRLTLKDAPDLTVTGAVKGTQSVSLADTGTLTIGTGGSVTGSTTSLAAAAISVAGSVTAASALTLTANTGAINETGHLSTGILTGSARGSASLTGTNSIAALGDFTAAGFTLTDTPDLDVTGSVNGTASASITDTGTLTVDGSVMALATSLSGSDLTLPGTLTGSNTLTLTATSGTIAETGALNTALLTGSSAGSTSLTGSNSIAALGNFTAAGFTLVDLPDLNVTGSVNGTSSVAITDAGTLTLASTGTLTGLVTNLNAASLALAGNISALGTLMLVATTGTIDETGTINAGVLTGSSAGSTSLTGTNHVVTLADFAATGFVFDDISDLDLTGSVAGTTSAAIDDVGVLTVDGSVDADATSLIASSVNIPGSVTGTTTAALVANAGTIAETGSVTTALLTGSATGSAALTGTNSISSLGSFTSAGLILNDTPDLTIVGNVDGGPSVTVTDAGNLTVGAGNTLSGTTTLLTAASITVDGTIEAPAALVLTASTGTIAGTGIVDTGLLTGSAADGVDLTGANLIASIGSFSAESLVLNDGEGLTAVGPVSGGTFVGVTDSGTLTIGTAGSLTATDVNLVANAIAIDGSVTGSNAVMLAATTGTISESGTLTTAALTGSAAGAASFTGTNFITYLGDFTSAGFILTQAGDLDVTGTVAGGTLASITDGGTLTIDGSVTAAATSLTGGALVVSFNGTATGSNSLTLTATTDSIDEAGTLDTALLTGSAVGSASLTGHGILDSGMDFGSSNQVGTLGNFTAAGFTLDDEIDLSVEGNVDGMSGVNINAAALLAVPGNITADATELTGEAIIIPGSVTGTSVLSLATSGGPIVETGSIATALLQVTSPSDVSLTGSNTVAQLGGVTAASFLMDDVTALTVIGTVTAPVTTISAASLTIPGTIVADTSVELHATSGVISESGSIDTALLTGSATAAAAFSGSNSITTLGSFTSAGFVLADAAALGIAGPLDGGALVNVEDDAGLTVSGSVAGSTTVLTAATIDIPGTVSAGNTLSLGATTGTIGETGQIIAASLGGSAAGSASLLGNNQIGTITNFSAAGFGLNDASSLIVAGALSGGPSVGIASAGTVSVPGSIDGSVVALTGASIGETGSITAPTSLSFVATVGDITTTGLISTGLLTGSAVAGSALFTGSNDVATLGDFAAMSSFQIIDTGDLAVTGAVTAGTAATVLATDSIDIPGSIAANQISLVAQGGTIASTGVVNAFGLNGVAGNLTGSAAGLASFTGANAIDTLGPYTSAGLILNDTVSLAVTGAVASSAAVTLTSTGGSISGTGGITAPELDLAAATSIDIGGTNTIGTIGTVTSQGNFTLLDNVALTIAGPITTGPGSVDLTAAGLTIAGDVTAFGTLALTASAGGITQTDGTLTATAGAGTIVLNAPGTITLESALSGQDILIGKVTNVADAPQEVILDGATITTGGNIKPGTTKPVFPKTDGTVPGFFILTDLFQETGTTVVNANGAAATMEISLATAKGGAINFDPSFDAGLLAPTTELFLNLANGSTAGHIVVAGLAITYTPPATPDLSNLQGTIGGLGGETAAGRAYILPLANANYRFNSCAIQSVNCILLSPVIVPIFNPTADVIVESPRRRREDDDLIIPNVGEEDF